MAVTRRFGCRCNWEILRILFFSVLMLANALATSIDYHGEVIVINGISYYGGLAPVAKFAGNVTDIFRADVDFIPLTVIRTVGPGFSKEYLDNSIANFTTSDDVFQSGFLQG